MVCDCQTDRPFSRIKQPTHPMVMSFGLSGVLAARGNFGDLRTVPDSNDPYDFSLQPIEKTVRPNDDLSMR